MKDKSFYLSVIDSLRNRSAEETSGVLKISKQSLNYYLKQLKILGVVEKVGYGVWKVNDSKISKIEDFVCKKRPKQVKKRLKKDPLLSSKQVGVSSSDFFTSFHPSERVKSNLKSDTFRTHDLQFVLKIPKLRNWSKDKRREFLSKNFPGFKPIQQGERLFVGGCRVWLTNISIVVWIPHSYFVDDPVTGYNYGIHDFLGVVGKIESLLRINLRVRGNYMYRLSRQHQALIKNALARQYNKAKKKLYVFDERGNWLLIDDSEHLDECEVIGSRGVDGVESRRDAGVVQTFFNELKDTELTPSKIMQMIAGNTSNLNLYAENMVSHVKAVQDLSKGVVELRGAVLSVKKSSDKVSRKSRSRRTCGRLSGQASLFDFGGF